MINGRLLIYSRLLCISWPEFGILGAIYLDLLRNLQAEARRSRVEAMNFRAGLAAAIQA
jgi:hypothetical protein